MGSVLCVVVCLRVAGCCCIDCLLGWYLGIGLLGVCFTLAFGWFAVFVIVVCCFLLWVGCSGPW